MGERQFDESPRPLEATAEELHDIRLEALNLMHAAHRGEPFGEFTVTESPRSSQGEDYGIDFSIVQVLGESVVHIGYSSHSSALRLEHKYREVDMSGEQIQMQYCEVLPTDAEAAAIKETYIRDLRGTELVDIRPAEPYSVDTWKRGLLEVRESRGQQPPKKPFWKRLTDG